MKRRKRTRGVHSVEAAESAAVETEAWPRVPPVLLDVPDAADALGGISEGKLRDLTRSGELKAIRIGRRVFYRPQDLALYAEQQALRS